LKKGLPIKNERILFFDGVCNLCNGLIDFLIRHEDLKKAKILFAPLQGSTANQLLGPEKAKALNTVIFYDQGMLSEKSNGVLNLFKYLPAPWSWLTCTRIVPRFIRDWVYDLVAKNRYQVFGKRALCRLPTAEERTHFLD